MEDKTKEVNNKTKEVNNKEVGYRGSVAADSGGASVTANSGGGSVAADSGGGPTPAVKNLSSLPFGSIIGAPLTAAVDAQASAARSTVDFIHEVGFQNSKSNPKPAPKNLNDDPDSSDDGSILKVLYVVFNYKLKNPNQSLNNAESEGTIQVPLLTIVPIPFLRIKTMTIDFVAKLTDAYQNDESAQTVLGAKVGNQTSLKGGGLFVSGSTAFQASFSASHKSTSHTTNRYNNELTMTVHLEAGNDDIPAGMGRILGILESNILDSGGSKPPTPTPGPNPSPNPDPNPGG